jgi:hypothetical protein
VVRPDGPTFVVVLWWPALADVPPPAGEPIPSVWLWTVVPFDSFCTNVSSRVRLMSLDERRDPVHCPVKRLGLPMVRTGRVVENSVEPQRAGQQVEGGRTLGAQRALVDRAARITLDVNDLTATRIDAVSADAGADLIGNERPCRQLRRFSALGGIRSITLSEKLAWQSRRKPRIASARLQRSA